MLMLVASLLGNVLLLSSLVVSRTEYNLTVTEINRRLSNIEGFLGMFSPRTGPPAPAPSRKL